jgi:hypothetical protein
MPADAQISETSLANEVGRLVLNWTHLEMTAHIVLWLVADLASSNVGRMTSGIPPATIWEQTALLLTERNAAKDVEQWYKVWTAKAHRLKDERNRAVHGWWFATGDAQAPYTALDAMSRGARKGIRENVVPRGQGGIMATADAIVQHTSDLVRWVDGPLDAPTSQSVLSPTARETGREIVGEG